MRLVSDVEYIGRLVADIACVVRVHADIVFVRLVAVARLMMMYSIL